VENCRGASRHHPFASTTNFELTNELRPPSGRSVRMCGPKQVLPVSFGPASYRDGRGYPGAAHVPYGGTTQVVKFEAGNLGRFAGLPIKQRIHATLSPS